MEVVGLVVGVGALLPDIISGANKIQRFWKEVKDCPQDVTFLLEDIELQVARLQYYERRKPTGQELGIPPEVIAAAEKRCSFALDDIEAFARDLQSELSRAAVKPGVKLRYASFKCVLKKERLRSLQTRLGHALQGLSYCIQLQSENFADQRHSLYMEKLSLIASQQISLATVNAQSPANLHQSMDITMYHQNIDCNQIHNSITGSTPCNSTYPNKKKARKARQTARMQIVLPSWLWGGKTYECYYAPRPGGFNAQLRVYNVISSKSHLYEAIRKGNEAEVRRLFSSNEASPFDRNEYGKSLLETSVLSCQVGITKLLLEMGLQNDIDVPVGEFRSSPLTMFISKAISAGIRTHNSSSPHGPEFAKQREALSSLRELLLPWIQVSEDIPVQRLFDMVSSASYDDLHVLLYKEIFMPNYDRLSMGDKAEAVRLGSWSVSDPVTLYEFLDPTRHCASAQDHCGARAANFSLVHSGAIALSYRYADSVLPRNRHPWWGRVWYEAWTYFICDMLAYATPEDLHSVEMVIPWDIFDVPAWFGTPLVSVIGSVMCFASSFVSMESWDTLIQRCSQQWLHILKTMGVDLAEYGSKELKLWNTHGTDLRGALDTDAIYRSRNLWRPSLRRASFLPKTTYFTDSKRHRGSLPIRLISFDIGSEPLDWKIFWALEYEPLAKEFLEIAEKIHVRMPGAWVES